MDGQGAWRDNVFVERLCRTIKYEEIYLRAWETGSQAKAALVDGSPDSGPTPRMADSGPP